MPRRSVSIQIDRSCEEVFDLVHDYQRRLEWDTLLRDARLLDGATRAERGARSRCAGKWATGGMGVETEYVTFERGRVAAVKLTNRPPFSRRFAASIRHRPLDRGGSELTYIFYFEAKPRILAWLLDPLMVSLMTRETGKRLRALKAFLEHAPPQVNITH